MKLTTKNMISIGIIQFLAVSIISLVFYAYRTSTGVGRHRAMSTTAKGNTSPR